MASERGVWLVALALLGTCGCFAPRGYLVTYWLRRRDEALRVDPLE